MGRLGGIGVALAVVTLAACGGSGGDQGTSGRAVSAGADCPPEQKGNGIMVSSRYDYEDLLEANRWRSKMFPSNCAGSLADYVPDMPEGFGVVPTNKPYVMNGEQVYVAYGELPDPLYLEDDIPNVPVDLNRIEYEIVRFNDEEMVTLTTWMSENPDNYLSGSINGQDVYLIGGFGSGRPGKGDRLATSLHAILDGGIVVRVSHKSLFSQRGGLQISPLVEQIMGDILNGAEGAG